MRRIWYYGSSFVSAQPLLLDLYPMKVGFSLRKLRNAFAGYPIRVRRTLDGLESDIPFDGLYLDIAFLLNFCQGSSAYVTRIYNQGTLVSGHTAYQTSTSSQFMIVNNGVLNLDGIYAAFNLYGFDWMDFPNVLDGGETSIFSVSRNNVSNAYGTVFASTLSSERFAQVNDRRTQKRHSFIQTTSLFTADLNSHQPQGDKRYLSTFIDSSKNLSSYYNGVFQNSVQYSGDYVRDTNRIGRDFFGYLSGNLQELLIDTNDWSADRAAIETNQSDFYGS